MRCGRVEMRWAHAVAPQVHGAHARLGPLYLTFVFVRAWWWPHAGPGAGGSPYPYDFLNLPAVGWAQFGIACLKVLAAFLASGAVVCLVDRALPEHTLAK